jgi:hypothetical protein
LKSRSSIEVSLRGIGDARIQFLHDRVFFRLAGVVCPSATASLGIEIFEPAEVATEGASCDRKPAGQNPEANSSLSRK